MPIYLAAIGPKNVALAAEIADGWLPIFFSPERFAETHVPVLEEGFAAAAGGPTAGTSPRTSRSSSPTTWRRPRGAQAAARTVRGRDGRQGAELLHAPRPALRLRDADATVQDLYLAGKKGEAAAAVPDALVDEVALVGDRARIADRLAALRECGVDTLVLQARQPEALRLLADLA